ncbi:hypothetical protein GCM10022224_018380 [Nonomuraea antimicrobica]|uniref:Uncharacterized protein n=2 Tax=Nonomuraea antimicrobica TaxID=561173 RepID=A0ABP7BEE2_9ACTN
MPPKHRFLVLHDYGMGGLWWWIWARSERELVERLAEVEVVGSPDAVARAETWNLDEVDIDADRLSAGLDDLRAKREIQRSRPGFGALAGRDLVHLREPWEDEHGVTIYLAEVGPDGRRLRQVEVAPDGTAVRSAPTDWVLNPPIVDLFDPEVVGKEIGREEFERAWRHARPETDPSMSRVHEPAHEKGARRP